MKRDKGLAKFFRQLPCHICGAEENVVGHHLLTVGAHPELKNVRENMIALCPFHHAEIHSQTEKGMTLAKFVRRYCLESEMEKRGFAYDDYQDKWFLPIH